MVKTRLLALFLLILGVAIGYFVYVSSQKPEARVYKPFQLGLDLSGGTHLEYRADVDEVAPGEANDSVEALRDIIERRINLFGVAEPNVQTETVRLGQGKEPEYRLVVELPGVTDVEEAIAMIGQTPLLEFKLKNPNYTLPEVIDETTQIDYNKAFTSTGLTGRYLTDARTVFPQGGTTYGTQANVMVGISFNKEGAALFSKITREHKGEILAIFLDGTPISTPVIQAEITDGEAVITGDFTADEAKQLAGRLKSGALPVPIDLIATESIGPSLGAEAVEAGVMAGIFGFIFIAAFLILWYRLPGLLAVIALGMYAAILLALFKLLPITLTASGIAGFVISMGVAVDANILIFERVKEEILLGKSIRESLKIGFHRAWYSIRDSNISDLIVAVVLFGFGSSLIKGFALTFGLGILVSMLTAITVSRVFLMAVSTERGGKYMRFFYKAGIR